MIVKEVKWWNRDRIASCYARVAIIGELLLASAIEVGCVEVVLRIPLICCFGLSGFAFLGEQKEQARGV